jgi:hypothetical protein
MILQNFALLKTASCSDDDFDGENANLLIFILQIPRQAAICSVTANN